MDIVFARSEASATQVLAGMDDPPSRASVRTLLRILEAKGHLKHVKRGREFIYQPTKARKQVGQSALRRVLGTFFGGSLEQAIAAHLTDENSEPTEEELDRVAELIRKARERGQ